MSWWCDMEEGEAKRYDRMDFSDLTKIIFSRVQKFEPESVAKIMGCILLKEPGEQEMLQLAFGPETTLLSKIGDAKAMLGMLSQKNSLHVIQFGSYPPSASRPFSPVNLQPQPPTYWNPPPPSDQPPPPAGHTFDFLQRAYAGTGAGAGAGAQEYSHQSQPFLGLGGGLDEQMDAANYMGYYYSDASLNGSLTSRPSRRSHSVELSVKACHYFNKGFCKHGTNCRYYHGKPFPDGNSQLFADTNEFGHEDQMSLAKLEMEITELLRSKRGSPVSIASLPMMYFDKYGKNLQAEGYLTESQRHGKTGLSLSKLLSRLKNSIRVIDRPHGQHSVILAEDAPRYMDSRNDRNDSSATVSSSHQIYLTFPADSTFTEDDVSNYFKRYGQVRDVRIPCQEKRMFGFVSFMNPETVSTILMKRNPHFICGARVLVKPYREKSRMVDKSYAEKIKPQNYYQTHYLDADLDLHAVVRESDTSRLLKQQVIEEQEKMLELERMRLSELNMAPKSMSQQPFLHLVSGDFYMDHFSYALDAFNNNSVSDDEARNANGNYGDQQDSGHIELPDSPFASPTVGRLQLSSI